MNELLAWSNPVASVRAVAYAWLLVSTPCGYCQRLMRIHHAAVQARFSGLIFSPFTMFLAFLLAFALPFAYLQARVLGYWHLSVIALYVSP